MASGGGANEPPRPLWLDAWSDPVAGVSALSGCIHTSNLFGDGDWRLVIADSDLKLKVWKGTARASEHALLEPPIALTSFVPDGPPPRSPVLTVAAGCHVYMYRGLRPFYKFVLPLLPSSADEGQLWQQMDAGELNPSAGCAALAGLRDAGFVLSDRGSALLAAAAGPRGEAGAAAYAAESRGQPLGRQSSITCMDVVLQAADEPNAPSCLVLGTEDGRVLVLNAAGAAVQQEFGLGSALSFLALSGTLGPSLRLSATTRDGRLHMLRAGGEGGSQAVQLESQSVGLVRRYRAKHAHKCFAELGNG